MASFRTRDCEELQVMNMDEEIMRINGNDGVSFNRRDKLSQVVLMDGRILIFSGSQTKEAIATQQSVKRILFISWFAGSLVPSKTLYCK